MYHKSFRYCLTALVLAAMLGAAAIALAQPMQYRRFQNPQNSHIYDIILSPMTWHAAQSFAAGNGGHLATIASPEENSFVCGIAAQANIAEFWIGATNEGAGGYWRWVTGETLTYNAFAPGRPDSVADDDRYIAMFTNAPCAWYDLPEGSLPFIVEYDQQPAVAAPPMPQPVIPPVTPPAAAIEAPPRGNYCCDSAGARRCQLGTLELIGTACACPAIAGEGRVCP